MKACWRVEGAYKVCYSLLQPVTCAWKNGCRFSPLKAGFATQGVGIQPMPDERYHNF
jgi:hypothetical protein